MDLDQIYHLMPKQKAWVLNNKFQSILSGGFGNGKTSALCYRALAISMKYPKTLGLIGRATYPELRDSTIRSFLSIANQYKLVKNYQQQQSLVTLVNGSEVVFRALDDPMKIKSMNLAYFGIDQIEETTEEMYLELLGRLRDPQVRFAFGVCNPEPNWVKVRFKDNQAEDTFLTECTSYENPYLPADYVDNLIKNYPQFWVKRYVYGSWDVFEGQVFKEFVESKHVIPVREFHERFIKDYVIDYGYRNPFACLKFITDYDDNHYVVDEHYEAEKLISYHAQKIKDLGYKEREVCWIDPSCASKIREKNGKMVSIMDELQDEGILTRPADNSSAGFNRINEWFKKDKLFILENCFNTIREIKGLRWKKVKSNWDKNLPEEMEDRNNHTTDCLNYYANSRPDVPEAPKPKNWPLYKHFEDRKKPKKQGDWYNE